MAGIYTYQNLLDDSKRDAGSITNILRLANRAARFVVDDIDLRSLKRRVYLSPGLNEDQFDYKAPADMKDAGLIDIRRVAGRLSTDKFNLTTTEYFDRLKASTPGKNIVCIEDRDFLRTLRLSADLHSDDQSVDIHECDSITSDGTWTVGGSGSNLTLDSDIYIHGDASLNFDASASYTSILMTNSDMDAVDLSDYETGGSVYVFVWIPSTTGLTGFKLRVGSDSSNYFESTSNITVTNENLAFSTGWNLLRFDFTAMTETGTADLDNVDYVRLAIVGDGTAAATTDWRLDYIVARRGVQHEVWYYTKYPWQSSSGTYLENSTAATDLLNADTEEYELFILKLKEFIALDREQFDDVKIYRDLYIDAKATYELGNPSERLLMIQTYWNFGSDPGEDFLTQ